MAITTDEEGAVAYTRLSILLEAIEDNINDCGGHYDDGIVIVMLDPSYHLGVYTVETPLTFAIKAADGKKIQAVEVIHPDIVQEVKRGRKIDWIEAAGANMAKLYYTGSTSYCKLTDHSCRKLGVPIGSSFSLLDPYLCVYEPCKTGGRDNTSKRLTGYELINRNEFVPE